MEYKNIQNIFITSEQNAKKTKQNKKRQTFFPNALLHVLYDRVHYGTHIFYAFTLDHDGAIGWLTLNLLVSLSPTACIQFIYASRENDDTSKKAAATTTQQQKRPIYNI